MVSKGKVKHLKWLLAINISVHYAIRAAIPGHLGYGMTRFEYHAYCKRNGFKP